MTQAPGLAPRPASAPALARAGEEPPLQDVLVELWHNLEKLVRQEVALAGAELDAKAQKLRAELSAMAIGAGLLLAGALTLVAAVVLILALFMPAWLAALLTGAAAAAGGFALIKSNKPTAADVVPERTIQNLKKDLRTLEESTK